VGRPPIQWTSELTDAICAAIAVSARGLDEICEENAEFPTSRSIYSRLIVDEDFFRKYARAREMQQQLLCDQLIPLADKDRICEKRTIKADGSEERVILDQVERSKLQIDTRKWYLSKLNPKRFGDKVHQEVTGPGGGPLKASVTVEFVNAPNNGQDATPS
jgi:hypothetical protein